MAAIVNPQMENEEKVELLMRHLHGKLLERVMPMKLKTPDGFFS